MIITAISNAFLAVANYFGWARQRSEVKNSPAMQQARSAQNEQSEHDRINKNIASGNAEEQAKDISL